MIELFYWPTPNGHKVTLFLEESGVSYKLTAVNIGKGDQFKPEFLAISPNNRMPAIVDHEPAGGGTPISVFESGAILMYLADKTGKFLPKETRARYSTLQWLFWQMGGLGPMAGQNTHFNKYAPEKIPYAMDRYRNETGRLFRVLNTHLEKQEFVGTEYSIADMAIYPWVAPYEMLGQKMEGFPYLNRWLDAVAKRPATVRAYARAKEFSAPATMTPEAAKILFGQK